MRLLSLLPISLLVACVLGDDTLPPPGQPALDYTDGTFSEPNGGTSSYSPGNKMNISWTTTYETTNIYLIVGYDWAAPIQLTTNSAQTWFQWTVATDSTNSSEIYVFRGVNGTGTADQKAVGGFLSASFYIPVKEKTTPTTTFSTLTTSATAPAKTAIGGESSTTPTPTSTPNAGLSEGSKIGIGVGVGVGVVGLAALVAAFVFWRKSKGKQQPPGPQPYEMPLNGDFSPHFQNAQPYVQSVQPYDSNQQALAGYYKPPETGETRGAELDAGQGHQFIPEAHDQRVTRAELQ
ncbi:hypothetical protein FHL15_006341 [Xylaria flabelliformis]|uniref:Mid2 domain-containing protein n=1 Tax=Xylaria flabelliformis TaxID=2512241 RepID=A0A553HXJ8_9PEZI|nr:hypothetical protein FHL15_006341 [Xylaria flabelliformis]